MPDLEFEAEQSQSSQSQLKRQRIRDVKRFILAKLETEIQQQPSHESNLIPHIRLVSHGRLCSDSVLLATLFVGGGRSDSGSVPQAELGDTVVYLHAIITYEPRSSNESNLDTSSIAGEQQDEEEDHQEHDQPQQEQQIRPPRGGFDRLLDVGFPQEQVDQLRDQFQQVNNNNNNSAFITGPDGRPAPNFALEDEWMESNIINPGISSHNSTFFISLTFQLYSPSPSISTGPTLTRI